MDENRLHQALGRLAPCAPQSVPGPGSGADLWPRVGRAVLRVFLLEHLSVPLSPSCQLSRSMRSVCSEPRVLHFQGDRTGMDFSNFLVCPVAGTSDSSTVRPDRPRASRV